MIRQLVETISGYPGLLGFCAASGVLFPLPEDFALIYGGVQIAEGKFTWAPTLVSAFVGVQIRDIAVYWMGRVLGDRLLQSALVQRWVGNEIERAEGMFRDHGVAAVLVGRFLIGFRAPMFAVAGASHLSFRKFCAWNSLGMLVAVPGMVWLGWFFGHSIADTMYYAMSRAREVVAICVVAGVAYGWWTMSRNNSGEA